PWCFKKELENRVRRTIAREHMLYLEDKLAFALSGGKDSVVLVKVLYSIYGNLLEQQKRLGRPPVAITIDEGIEGYRAESLLISKRTCDELGLKHVIFSFKKEFGLSLDEMIEKVNREPDIFPHIKEKKAPGQLKNAWKIITKPCSICGVLRRKLLNDIAAGLNVTRLATGHNLNDEAETFLMNMFKGDIPKIGRTGSIQEVQNTYFVRKIKPLKDTTQKDIVLYLYYTNGRFQSNTCPHAASSPIFRGEIQEILNNLDDKHPGILYNISKFMKVVKPALSRESSLSSSVSKCKVCGAPKSKDMELCMTCYYVRNICGKDYKEVLDYYLRDLKD
ncbi:MAG: ATP-binding protein, partial [Promethearchaeota archaeon]